jgi:hypothetical protein
VSLGRRRRPRLLASKRRERWPIWGPLWKAAPGACPRSQPLHRRAVTSLMGPKSRSRPRKSDVRLVAYC